ncbi:hypothetical protein SUGI_0624300 [Cryptomeria japonica]|uniref:cytochrome b561 and DOMON domain-containing protein At5g35735 n=1 Tax=Cryptomeria japonica TaxID=3369 RepID=UPI0024147EFC|nr:cytochrome b561 and DOMON domain-containing protein At5g35735 [Cryptomeria japonica]GLJ31157.1 hypothetical protein SUGI_0624300 [Cryptomeria japonica]
MANCKFFAPLMIMMVMAVDLAQAQSTCSKSFSSSNRLFSSCQTLKQLSSNFAWSYDPENGTIKMAFTAKPDTSAGWVSWGINPAGTGMVGTRSLIAFKHSNGTMVVTTYNITTKKTAPKPSAIDYKVEDMAAEFSGGQITIYATWTLMNNKTSIYHVWQTGPTVSGMVPGVHTFNTDNLASLGSIDLSTGVATASSGSPRTFLKNRHGVLNVVGWSIMLPIGVIIARYMRAVESADPLWFYLHVFCQISGFAIGVAGWATGLKLGSSSKGIVYRQHRNIGIAVFAIATAQMFALLVRPNKENKYRKYWNIYHHSVGYTIVVLSIVNIFKGFDMLQPEHKWKRAYIGVLIGLGGVAVFLEIISWIAFFVKKSSTSSKRNGV